MAIIDKPVDISPELLEAIRTFPLRKEVEHCGVTFFAPALEFYAKCPRCGGAIKLRACAGVLELEDVFGAVLDWMIQRGAAEIVSRRQQAVAQDQGE